MNWNMVRYNNVILNLVAAMFENRRNEKKRITKAKGLLKPQKKIQTSIKAHVVSILIKEGNEEYFPPKANSIDLSVAQNSDCTF